jgi:hypothetical protein
MNRKNKPINKENIEVKTDFIPDKQINKPKFPECLKGIDYQEVKNLCLLGLTIRDIAKVYNVNPDTFYVAIQADPELSEIVYTAKTKEAAKVATALHQAAKGYSHKDTYFHAYKGKVYKEEYIKHHAPDFNAAKLILQSVNPEHFNKADKQDITISGNLQAYQTSQKLDNLDQKDLENLLKATNKLKQNKDND